MSTTVLVESTAEFSKEEELTIKLQNLQQELDELQSNPPKINLYKLPDRTLEKDINIVHIWEIKAWSIIQIDFIKEPEYEWRTTVVVFRIINWDERKEYAMSKNIFLITFYQNLIEQENAYDYKIRTLWGKIKNLEREIEWLKNTSSELSKPEEKIKWSFASTVGRILWL